MRVRSLAIIFFVATTVGSVHSNDRRDKITRSAVLHKIAPWVLDRTAQNSQTECLVVLSEQADLSGAASLDSKAERGDYVYHALWAKAQETQGPIIQLLDQRKIKHRSFYIVNAILVTADRSLVMDLAGRSDVGRIEGNPQIQNLPPVSVTASESAASATAIEENITFTRAPEVWAEGFTGQGAVIGGADTGYLFNHSALKNQYQGGRGKKVKHDFNWHDSIHSRGGSCGPDSPAPCDDRGHGTHTMGIAVGEDGNGNQIGMAPGAKWIGCRNMDQGSGTPASYMECFEFFLAPYPVNGTPAQGDPSKAPDVTTNSWTCPHSEGCSALTLQAAVEAERAAGIVTVVAAGNSLPAGCSSIADPPSLYDAVFSVGAVDHSTGTIAEFSERGPITIDGSNRVKPDITAPGVLVRSSWNTSTTSYAVLSGTSMSAPHIAGAIALMLSADPSLRGNVSAIEGILEDSAFHIPDATCGSGGWPNNVYGYGRVDAKAATDIALIKFSLKNAVFTVAGGDGLLNVSAPMGIPWNAASNAGWIAIASGPSGSGNGVVGYNVAPNLGPDGRVGTITIARRDFVVFQAGTNSASCAISISSTNRTVPASGASGAIEVTCSSGCIWTATSDASWINVAPNVGIASGTLRYTVDANAGPVRRGGITIGGQVFAIKQKAG